MTAIFQVFLAAHLVHFFAALEALDIRTTVVSNALSVLDCTMRVVRLVHLVVSLVGGLVQVPHLPLGLLEGRALHLLVLVRMAVVGLVGQDLGLLVGLTSLLIALKQVIGCDGQVFGCRHQGRLHRRRLLKVLVLYLV